MLQSPKYGTQIPEPGLQIVMINILISIVALIMLVVGLIALISPIPIGLVIIGGSVATLVMVNPRARVVLRRLRSTFIWLNKKFFWLELKLERKFPRLAAAFHLTRPEDSGDKR